MGKYREVTSADHLGRRKAPFGEVITKTGIQSSKFLNKVHKQIYCFIVANSVRVTFIAAVIGTDEPLAARMSRAPIIKVFLFNLQT